MRFANTHSVDDTLFDGLASTLGLPSATLMHKTERRLQTCLFTALQNTVTCHQNSPFLEADNFRSALLWLGQVLSGRRSASPTNA